MGLRGKFLFLPISSIEYILLKKKRRPSPPSPLSLFTNSSVQIRVCGSEALVINGELLLGVAIRNSGLYRGGVI